MTGDPSTGGAVTLEACAKINLTLDVFSRRADGYHGIASVMQSISLCDTLTATRTEEPGIRMVCEAPDEPSLPCDETNLAWRAAGAVLDGAAAAGMRPADGVALRLTKRIPAGAGLGGGSSDAAAALRAVNAVLALGLAVETLARMAAALGSDVPFFLAGGTAVARGRGENLTVLPDAPPFWMVIVKPLESVSTAWAYGELDLVPDRASHRATGRVEKAIREGDSERLTAWHCNDFELPVFEHIPAIAWLRDELMMAGAVGAHLCGSGSAVYGIATDEPAARRIAALMTDRYPRVFVARTITRAQATTGR